MKIGFIGCGNMGAALAKAIVKKISEKNIFIYDKDSQKENILNEEIGCNITSNEYIFSSCDFIFLAVKPQILPVVLSDNAEFLKSRKSEYTLVSMAAGFSTVKINECLGFNAPIIRIMPNLACCVGEGMMLCSKTEETGNQELKTFVSLMEYSGKIDIVEEKFIDSYSIVTGCAPAYIALVAEALADGAVDIGTPRDKAYFYAAQTIKGAAELMLSSFTPSALKDAVCSPGGTTIEGIRTLESKNTRSSFIEAVNSSYNKTKNI